MGGLAFGWDESIDCIQSISLTSEKQEPLCLAHKTKKLFVGAGVWVKDDGYVLRLEHDAHVYYPWPAAETVKEWQSNQLVPDPLPPYSISVADYVFGYSLWLIILCGVAFSLVRRALTKRRHARDALIPVSLGPPKLETDGDRFIKQAMSSLLEPDEVVQHQALALRSPDEQVHVWFVVLTNRRLVLITSQRHFFKPVLENQGVEAVLRTDITNVTESNWELTFTLTGGNDFFMFVPPKDKAFSNQREFIRDVPRILGPAREVTGGVQVLG